MTAPYKYRFFAPYPSDEQTQLTDYVELLKIMILVIGKINEEFCLTGNRD